MKRALICCGLVLGMTVLATAGDVERLGSVEFLGTIHQPHQISAIGTMHGLLLLGADEMVDKDRDQRNVVQVLKPTESGGYQTWGEVNLLSNGELDIEGIACDGQAVYVVGSHAWTRKRLSPQDDYAKNRMRLTQIDDEGKRDRLFRFALSRTGEASDLREINLRKIIAKDSVLKIFCETPSKENGVDIEGIAAQDQRILLGFRGPVLRGNYVPVMVFSWEDPSRYELRYLCLDGLGIRDLTSVKDGFLVVAGPVGDGSQVCRLYHWDGVDCVPGTGHDPGKVTLLGDLPPPDDASPNTGAEGIAVLSVDRSGYEIIVVYDGLPNGGPTRFRVTW